MRTVALAVAVLVVAFAPGVSPVVTCGTESTSCDEFTGGLECCDPFVCTPQDEGDPICLLEMERPLKFAVAGAYLERYKPWLNEEERETQIIMNEKTFHQFGVMLKKKNKDKTAPQLFDYWDSLDMEEQERRIEVAQELYPEIVKELTEEEELGVGEDGYFEL